MRRPILKTITTIAKRSLLLIIALCGIDSISLAQSPSHSYINMQRSAYNTHYFVSIGALGMGGSYNVAKPGSSDEKPEFIRSAWQGYGIRNEIGVEFLKFLHFGLAHTSLNLRAKDGTNSTNSGSRFEGNGSLNFYSPVGNLQLGGAILASQMDLRSNNFSSNYYGSGYLYNIGYNYFLTSAVSIYLDARKSQEHLARNSGQDLPSAINSKLSEAGMGFKIWF